MLAPAPSRSASRADAAFGSMGQAPVFAVGYALAAAITALAISLAASPPGTESLSQTGRLVLGLLSFNLVLILVLAGVIGWRVMRLIAARRDPGARLHLRFVALFAIAAVTPAVVVALFFGLLVTRGIDSWFGERVTSLVENYSLVGRELAEEQADDFTNVMIGMAEALTPVAPTLETSPLRMSGYLTELAGQQELIAAYLIDSRGSVLARAESMGAPPYVAPPAAELRRVGRGDQPIAEPFPSADLLRAVYPLQAAQDVFLYVAWPEDGEVLERLEDTYLSVRAYRQAAENRERVQTVFALSYMETALLVLVGAVWVGMWAATRIAAPVGRLVQAADRVAAGDLTAQVETKGDLAEIAVLSHAFNRMTDDLKAQQEALRAAGEDAEARRRFIETVLSRVSAGVIGLDGEGRISAANQQALTLLGLVERQAVGRPLQDVASELAGVADRAGATRTDVEEDVDLTRHGETRRLRARASSAGEAGLVITFDDITRLVTAQRNAAWRDVARRIAHEIKNPLTPIQLSAERLKRKYRSEIGSDVETFDRCTDTIIRQVGDIGRMVDEFSAFARMPAPKFARENAAELLRQAVFAQRVAAPDIEIALAEPLPSVTMVADGRMVGQALTNILKNAAEAIEARQAGEPGHRGHIAVHLTADVKTVTFEIEDDGVGLPARDRDRLTEPYVTKREKGTGLGLAIVKRILEDHGGTLTLHDSPELGGARICLRFGRDQQEASASADAALA